MAATAAFINSMLDYGFTGTITMKLFTGTIPSAGGTEVTGGGYAAQTLSMNTASSKVITADNPTFTDLPTVQIVAFGVYKGGTLIDEVTLNPSFTPDVTNNSLELSYAFNLNA